MLSIQELQLHICWNCLSCKPVILTKERNNTIVRKQGIIILYTHPELFMPPLIYNQINLTVMRQPEMRVFNSACTVF